MYRLPYILIALLITASVSSAFYVTVVRGDIPLLESEESDQ